MKRVQGFILQAVEEDTFAVAVTPEAMAIGTMIKLNSTAAFLFDLLETERTEGECVSALAEHFSVDPETARRDVHTFLKALKSARLLLDNC